MSRKVYARVPFTYTPGRHLDRGEVFRLKDFINDQKLLGLGYCVLFDDPNEGVNEKDFVRCGECGQQFINHGFLHMHKRRKGRCIDPDPKGISKSEFARLAGLADDSKIGRGVFPDNSEMKALALQAGPPETWHQG